MYVRFGLLFFLWDYSSVKDLGEGSVASFFKPGYFIFLGEQFVDGLIDFVSAKQIEVSDALREEAVGWKDKVHLS